VPEPEPQAILAPLSRAALVLVVEVGADESSARTVFDFCDALPGLVRSVGFRDLEAQLSCVMGVGAEAWPRLFPLAAPPGLHPFVALHGSRHSAPSTPGDLIFHIRAARNDLCFELATQILAKLGSAVTPVDEMQGFRFFDYRDLLGFVDGTENPAGDAAVAAALIGPDDPDLCGSSYLIVQRYLHDLDAWNAISTEEQEQVIGREKLSNVELDDAVTPANAHRVVNTVTGADGSELAILRENMPFGSPAAGEFGTYFIGYAADVSVTERMLERMFVGEPPGNHDRILDFSTAITGNLFFVPSASLLDELAGGAYAGDTEQSAPVAAPAQPVAQATSLTIGSLKDSLVFTADADDSSTPTTTSTP
jgi:porphyrinogen peroxidase